MQVRLGAALAATALTAATLAACGSDSGGSSEPADFDDETISADGETLTMWIMEGNAADYDPYFEDLGTAFIDETGAKLDVQYIPWTAAHDKFTTAMAGGTTPDVAEVGSTWTGEFGEAGGLYDLSDEVDAGRSFRRPGAQPGGGGHAGRRALRHALVRRHPLHRLPHRRARAGRRRAAHLLGRAGRRSARRSSSPTPTSCRWRCPARASTASTRSSGAPAARSPRSRTAPGRRRSTPRRPSRACSSTPTSPSRRTSPARPPPPGTRPRCPRHSAAVRSR